MQVDCNQAGDPIRNLWAAVILTAFDDLKIPYESNPFWSSQINRQINRRQAIWFFSNPQDSTLDWICQKLNIDLEATVKRAHEICPDVKINLSFEKVEGYHKGAIKKAAHG
jgi:hypothetical protein